MIDALQTVQSASPFTIKREIMLTAPNARVAWALGTTQKITWSAAGVSNVKIELSRDGGAIWEEIAASVPAATGSYSWTVVGATSSNCVVRVSDVDEVTIKDLSDSTFIILDGSQPITVLSPNGGEVLTVGSTANILWAMTGVSDVTVRYSTDGGSTWRVIAAAINSNDPTWQNYPWTIPNTPSTDCLVMIAEYVDFTRRDSSDAPFTIQ